MAQPTLTLNGTDYADGSTVTGWDSPAELGSVAAMDLTVQTEFFIQGADAIGIAERTGGAVFGARFNITSEDFTVAGRKAQIYLWLTSGAIVDTLANGGARFYAADSDGDYAFWYVGGGNGETAWVGNGWKLISIDLNEPPDEQGGAGDALFNPSIVTYLGAAANLTGALGKADVIAIDQLRMVDSIEVTGNTLRFTDGTNGIALNENGASADTIVRNSGDFGTDGFEVGDSIEVRGANTPGNDGIYTITAVSTVTITIGIGDFGSSDAAGSNLSCEVEAEFTLQDIINEDQLNDTYYGIVSNGDTGSFEFVGDLIIGDVSGALYTSFRTTNEIIVIPDNNLTTGMSQITVAEDTGETRVRFGFSSGTGDDKIGFSGSIFYAAPDVYDLKYRLDFSPTITECLIFGSTFQNCEENGFLMSTSATDNELKSCNFVTSGKIQTSLAVVRKCFFIGTTSTDAALLWDSTNQDIADCQFLANTDATNNPAGIEHDDLGTPYAYTDLTFAGNDFDVFLPYPEGDITVNASGTSDPVLENEPGPGQITIINTKAINFHVDDTDANIVQFAQVYIQKSTPTAQFSGAGNTAGSTTLEVSSSIDSDIPTSGWAIVFDKSENETQPYKSNGISGSTITLAGVSGSATSDGTSTVLNDSTNFPGLFEGETIRNTSDGSWAVVDQITGGIPASATSIVTSPLRGGTLNTWGNTDAWSTGTLATTLVENVDTVDLPIANGQTDSSGDIPAVSINFGSSFSAIVRIRTNEGATKYIPFLTTITIEGDFSGSAVIAEDTVAT